ncbi:MAG TPA: hypothetical protein VJX94_13130 [Stellaceae bacterium]|nr:hypothetical protein [Stellaceae bacterium]
MGADHDRFTLDTNLLVYAIDNGTYADIGIKAIMPSAGLCGMARSTAGSASSATRRVRHNLAELPRR